MEFFEGYYSNSYRNYVVPLSDFAIICRICFSKEDLVPFQDSSSSRTYSGITNIHVTPDDGFPQNLCYKCVNTLADISDFIDDAKMNDAKLRKTLNNTIESTSFSEEDISIKDPNEDFFMPYEYDPWYNSLGACEGHEGERDMSDLDFENSEECVPEYIEMSDIQDSINQSISNSEPSICDVLNSGTTLQDGTSETAPTKEMEHIGGEASLELRNEKNTSAPKKTLVVRLMRLKILKLKAKSGNFKCKGKSNNFVTIHMGNKPQTITNVQSVKTGENTQEYGPVFSESTVEKLDEYHPSLKPERNVNQIDTQNYFSPGEENFDIFNEKASSVGSYNPRVNKRDFCLFCKKDVMCFATHVLTHHSGEREVARILSYRTNSKERRLLMSFLKKKSNYLKNSQACCNPFTSPNNSVLECTRCLGFHKQLCYHVRKCSANPEIKKIVQAEALSFLFPHRRIDEDLKSKVFPRMRADHVSMVAKKDALICDYGAYFMKTHPVETHIVHVTSRKMRELARFLIEVNKMNPSIKSLHGALQPQFYELIVNATRIIGKYDDDYGTYDCPTFVTSIGTTLKQCCDIAVSLEHEKKDSYAKVDTIFNLNMMIDLFGTNWKKDVLHPVRRQNL